MNNFPNKKDRQIVLFSWLFFFVMTSFSFIVLFAFNDLISILVFSFFLIVTIFFTVLVKKVSKNYKLKYIFNKKKYNQLLNESLPKFSGASDEFIKELKKRTLESYNCDGVLYYTPSLEETKWLFRGEDNKNGFLLLVNILITSIDNSLGFTFFINESKNLSNNPRLNFFTLYNQFLSGELRYLLGLVFELTDFDLTDNKMSIEYTDNLNKIKDKLNKEYTPLLFNFKDELLNVVDYFKEEANGTIV